MNSTPAVAEIDRAAANRGGARNCVFPEDCRAATADFKFAIADDLRIRAKRVRPAIDEKDGISGDLEEAGMGAAVVEAQNSRCDVH